MWSNHQNHPIVSRLDRFLISREWADIYPHAFHVALRKPTSDHCPIVLDLRVRSWGPKPFCFELKRLEEKGFPDLIHTWWEELNVQGWARYRLAAKLKLLNSISRNGPNLIAAMSKHQWLNSSTISRKLTPRKNQGLCIKAT